MDSAGALRRAPGCTPAAAVATAEQAAGLTAGSVVWNAEVKVLHRNCALQHLMRLRECTLMLDTW
jgi:hypothetical protein